MNIYAFELIKIHNLVESKKRNLKIKSKKYEKFFLTKYSSITDCIQLIVYCLKASIPSICTFLKINKKKLF
jgi:hypothetical protein